ncbi:MAG: 50S ribosomal protein L25 [Candidatus Saganbacteria bacterium]|nr:50S ribosomal protein L25 [Candidatus Saganbacteria bacterium]
MEQVSLEAQIRKIKGKACKVLRSQGLVPAVVYGRGMESLSIEINAKAFAKVISTSAGSNVIITLKISDNGKSKDVAVITHGLEINHITDQITHIDFHQIIMTEKIKTKVKIEVSGESEGVKHEAGVLVHGLREVEVECLPADIPEKFEINISALKLNDSLHVSDLVIPKDIVILAKLEEMIVFISPPSKEEEPVGPTAEEVLAAAAPAGEAGAPAAAGEAGAAPAAKGDKKEAGAAPAKAEKKEAVPAPAKK